MYEKIINSEERKIDKKIIQENNIEKYRKEMIMERPKTEPINLEENIKNMNQEILINPDEYKKTLNKYIVKYDLLIDSRDINQDNYELNKYILDLNNEINNIFAIELLQSIFPNSEYIVNESNNILHIEEVSGTIEEVEIPTGNYTKSELLTQLQTSINASLTSNYTISSNNVGVQLNNNEPDDSNFTDYTGVNVNNIFDNNLNNYWESNLGTDNPSFFIYDFKRKVNIKEYSFISKINGRPRDFKLEISNDGVTWIQLHSVTGQTTSTTKYKTYSFSNNTLHTRYVKFEVTNSSNGNNVNISVNEMIFKTYRDDIISIQSDLTGGESNYFNLRFFGGYYDNTTSTQYLSGLDYQWNYTTGSPQYASNSTEFNQFFNSGSSVSSFGGSGVHTTSINWANGGQYGGVGLTTNRMNYLPDDNYSWQVEGMILAPETGTYHFGVDGDDAVDVFVNGQNVAYWYGGHGFSGDSNFSQGNQVSGTITLQAGQYYTFRARMQENTGGDGIQVAWIRPSSGSWELVPGSVFYRSTTIGVPKYLDRSIGRLIGFDPIDLLNYSSYSSQNKVVLKNDENSLILNINDLVDFHILLDSNKNEYTYIKECEHQIKQLDKLETFRKLKITIKKNNNNFYNFNGLEHSYLLRIYYYNTNQVFKDTL